MIKTKTISRWSNLVFLIDNVPYISINRMFDGVNFKKHKTSRVNLIDVIRKNGFPYKLFTFTSPNQSQRNIKYSYHSPPYLRKYFDMPTQSLILIRLNDQDAFRSKCKYCVKRRLAIRSLSSFSLSVILNIEDHTETVIDTLEPYSTLTTIDTLLIHDAGVVCKVDVNKLIKLKVVSCDNNIVSLSNQYINTIPNFITVKIYQKKTFVCKIPRKDVDISTSPTDGLNIRFEFPMCYTIAYHDIFITPGKYYIYVIYPSIVFRGSYNLVR